MFHDSDDIEKLAEEVQAEHAIRLGGPDFTPMVPRPFKPRPRPRTAIISEAAQQAFEERTLSDVLTDALARWHP